MKRFLFSMVFSAILCVPVFAGGPDRRGWSVHSNIGPTFSNSTNATVATINAPGAGYKNCLEYATFFSTSAYTLYILDGLTTSYQLTLGASVIHQADFKEAWCGTDNTAMVIRSSSTVLGASNQINYRGFVAK